VQVDEGDLTLAHAEPAREYEIRAPVLNEHADAIRDIGKRVIGDIIENGRRLTECKKLLDHGNWLPWLEREFGWTDDTALNFMRVHGMAESRNFRDLNLPVSGLNLLAKPSTPEIVRDDVMRRAEAGGALSVGEIKRLIDEARGKKPNVTRAGDQELLRDICEAQARPDDPLVEELRRLVTCNGYK
jgi:hypothetical protein